MKPLINSYKSDQKSNEEAQGEVLAPKKKLAELMQSNKEKEYYIEKLEQQIENMTNHNQELGIQVAASEKEYQLLNEQQGEEKDHEEHEDEMNHWIQSVQKQNGLAQESIDSLLSIQYEGNFIEQQICLSCYGELKTGNQCKYLPCCHIFHSDCINNHLKVNKVCPACQEEVIV